MFNIFNIYIVTRENCFVCPAPSKHKRYGGAVAYLPRAHLSQSPGTWIY